jgi:Cu-Zn family superoxide dismutase
MASGLALAGLAVADEPRPLRAVAEIAGCNDETVTGRLVLLEEPSDEGIKTVRVELRVEGLTDGKRAVHIHETAACEPCSAAGGHHDPGPFGVTRPDSATDERPAPDVNHPFHMGDLVNVEVVDGVGHMKHVTNRFTLSPGRLSIFDEDGSAVIIHQYEDTYCDHEGELDKGCAGGPRAACGIIRLQE